MIQRFRATQFPPYSKTPNLEMRLIYHSRRKKKSNYEKALAPYAQTLQQHLLSVAVS